MYQPISRKDLRELKSKTDEINRVNRINNIVKRIYCIFIDIAKTQTITSYNYRINYHHFISEKNKLEYNDFINFINEKNKDDLIIGLKIFFPDCAINYKIISLFGIEAQKQITCKEEDNYYKLYGKIDIIYIIIDWS